ncbi:MAG: hypothetical protein NT062_11130 [Proteobacteria bacterium]|nr:hypothetical protein [Pseudomonadota bacterium]
MASTATAVPGTLRTIVVIVVVVIVLSVVIILGLVKLGCEFVDGVGAGEPAATDLGATQRAVDEEVADVALGDVELLRGVGDGHELGEWIFVLGHVEIFIRASADIKEDEVGRGTRAISRGLRDDEHGAICPRAFREHFASIPLGIPTGSPTGSGISFSQEGASKKLMPVDVETASLAELFASYHAILSELKRRKIVRTGNAPAGDYAEYLVSRALGGTLAPNSERSFDLTAPERGRIQVKCRLTDPASANSRPQLSAFRSFDFDLAAIVLLNFDYSVRRAVLIPVATIQVTASYRKHVNGYVVDARPAMLDAPGNTDITHALREVALG